MIRSREGRARCSQRDDHITRTDAQRQRRAHVVAGAWSDQHRIVADDAKVCAGSSTHFTDHFMRCGYPREFGIVAQGECQQVPAVLTGARRPVAGAAGIAAVRDRFRG